MRTCFEEIIADLKLSPATTAETLARDLFDRTRSVTNVQLFIQGVRAALQVEIWRCRRRCSKGVKIR